MDPSLANRVPQIIEIEEDDVIDLDGAEKTPEEVIYEWDAKIRKKFSMFGVADNENVLGDLMKEYLQSLQEIARSYDDNESLKNKVFCHISFLYSYYVELQCYTPPDNYLSSMEDILTLYCNLELEVIRPLKRKKTVTKIVSVCRRIIRVLTVYLLERNDHILHVLIKMNTNNVSNSCSEVLNVLYTHFLTKVPVLNSCDESFCRSYIVFQKWKEIRNKDDFEGMDKIMYKLFKRTPDSIKNNETLRQILMPACQSPVGIVLNLFRSLRDISDAYFKHVIAKKNIEMDDIVFNIDLEEDEPTLPVEDENEEEVTFLKAYYEVERNMSNLPQTTSLFTKCKEEMDEDDDDVEIVEITTAESQVAERIVISDDIPERTSNMNKKHEPEEAIAVPSLLTPAKEIPNLENLNGITKIAVAERSSPCPAPAELPIENDRFETATASGSVAETEPEADQPEVPLVSAALPSPQDSDLVREAKRTIQTKSVEVQAAIDQNYVYNDYGLTTPPFDVPADEHGARTAEACVYTNIGPSGAEPDTRTVEVQVDAPSRYDDFGLTPPNETPLDEHHARAGETRLYTNIGQSHADLGAKVSESAAKIDGQIEVNFEPEILPNTKKKSCSDNNNKDDLSPVENDSEYEDLDIPEMNYDTEEIDVESCHETDKDDDFNPIRVNPEVAQDSSNHQIDTRGLIDTGQEPILNTAPNIKEAELVTFNGGASVLKPLLASNRTNGQSKDVASPTKIVYTSAQRITSLDDFSKFESAIQNQWTKMKENHDLDEVMNSPVTKLTPAKHSFLSVQDKLEFAGPEAKADSRSSSPLEVTSPPFEAIDDFRNYFSDNVNGRVPPPHDARVPQGILKKSNSARKKNFRIMFHESTCDNSEERRLLVPKRVRRDRKLNLEPRVVIERLSFIENKMKKVLNNPPTLRVDYDKTTRHINEKDVVRCISPPRFSWIIDFPRSGHPAGSTAVKNREHLEKKPKKRKFDSQNNSRDEPTIRKPRAFRTSKKKPLGDKGPGRKRPSPGSPEHNFVSNKSDSEFDKLLNSGAYSNKPFRLDLTS